MADVPLRPAIPPRPAAPKPRMPKLKNAAKKRAPFLPSADHTKHLTRRGLKVAGEVAKKGY
jgi:hypothetical protein